MFLVSFLLLDFLCIFSPVVSFLFIFLVSSFSFFPGFQVFMRNSEQNLSCMLPYCGPTSSVGTRDWLMSMVELSCPRVQNMMCGSRDPAQRPAGTTSLKCNSTAHTCGHTQRTFITSPCVVPRKALIAVNPRFSVQKLDVAQWRKLFSGKISFCVLSWSGVTAHRADNRQHSFLQHNVLIPASRSTRINVWNQVAQQTTNCHVHSGLWNSGVFKSEFKKKPPAKVERKHQENSQVTTIESHGVNTCDCHGDEPQQKVFWIPLRDPRNWTQSVLEASPE